MKIVFSVIIFISFIMGCIFAAISVTIIDSIDNAPTPEIQYIPYKDTTSLNELVLTKELLRRTQDSLNAYKSDTTISADLFIAKYKLERIKYYNSIAAKGNNIKYLRGWINRVLNE